MIEFAMKGIAMEKDINLLLTTKNRKVFDEQAMLWPGVAVFEKIVWNCVCGEPDCIMHCVQSFGTKFFPHQEAFAEYLEATKDCKSYMAVENVTREIGRKYPMLIETLNAIKANREPDFRPTKPTTVH